MNIKVCIVTSWFPSTKHPNLTPFVYNFAKNLGRSGIKVSVITPLENGDKYISNQDFMTIYRIKSRKIPVFSIFKLLNRIKPDVVHVHAPNLFSSHAIVASKLKGIPVVASVYRGEIDLLNENLSKPLRKILYLLRKFTLNRFDKIIALSHFSMALAINAGADKARLSIIYNSCEESLFQPRDNLLAKDKCGLPPDKRIILFVGNLIKIKGVYTLVEALKMLNDKYPDSFVAVLLGQGDERGKLEELVQRYGLANNVKFIGWIPQTLLPDYYNAADVFVLPSVVEGHSIALLEAMASGLPLIASNIEGNRESVLNLQNGLLFESGNTNMLAECLETILTNSELRHQMSMVNPQIYSQRFSTHAQISNYTNLYITLLNGGATEDTTHSVVLVDNHGLSFYTSYLARGLSKYKRVHLIGISYEDYIVTGASKSERVSFLNAGEKLPKSNSILSILMTRQLVWFGVLFSTLSRSKFDIIHIQGHLPTFFIFIPFLKLMRKPIIWTLHDVDLRPSSLGIRGRLELLYVRTVAQPSFVQRYADKIIVHGNSLKGQLVSKGVRDSKIVIVPIFDYGYLLEDAKLNNIHNERVTSDNGYILVFGRIKPYKGIDIFVNALRIVRKKLGNSNLLRVLIAGKGDASYFKHLLTEEEMKYIEIRNEFIPHSKIPDLFQRSRFVVLPYTEASQSAVTSLAYTFSRPVVASSAGSIGEYVEHNRTGLIFEPGNAEQLAEYIIDLIEHPLRCTEMGENANRKLFEEMSLDKCSQIINESYDQLLGMKRRG